MTQMNSLKPSESSNLRLRLSRLPRFLIGRDHRGNWVVQDRAGLCGGLFVNRAEALHFAMHEYDDGPQAVVMVPGTLELDVSRSGRSPAVDSRAGAETHLPTTIELTPHRRAAVAVRRRLESIRATKVG